MSKNSGVAKHRLISLPMLDDDDGGGVG